MHVGAMRLTGAMLLFCVAGTTAFAGPLPPDQVVRETANATMTEIRQRSDELTKKPELLYALVEERLVPNFDINLIARQVLGRYWTQAKPEQRARFIAAFRRLLVRTYATALLTFKDGQFEWLPLDASPDATEATIRSTISHADSKLSVQYKVHLVEDKWLVEDITIDGVSLVTNYRGIFVGQLKRSDIEEVIDRMEKKVAS